MAYIGNKPTLVSSEFREEFSVTTNQTAFNTSGFDTVEVYRNGVLLGESDYTKGIDNSTITLNNAAVNGDIVVITGRREITQGVQVTEHTEEIIATASTTVTIPPSKILDPGRTHVFVNGVKQQMTNTNGTTTPDISSINTTTGVITFASALAAGDIITVVSREQSVSDDIQQVSHYSTLTSSFVVPSGINQSFFGPTTYSGTINVLGNLVHAHGAFNLSGTMTVSGSLNIV